MQHNLETEAHNITREGVQSLSDNQNKAGDRLRDDSQLSGANDNTKILKDVLSKNDLNQTADQHLPALTITDKANKADRLDVKPDHADLNNHSDASDRSIEAPSPGDNRGTYTPPVSDKTIPADKATAPDRTPASSSPEPSRTVDVPQAPKPSHPAEAPQAPQSSIPADKLTPPSVQSFDASPNSHLPRQY